MPYDIEINTKTPKVKLLYSPIVELFACIQLLAIPSHHEDMKKFAKDTEKHLSQESKLLLDDISQFQYHGLELFDLILDIDIVDNIILFVEQLLDYSDIKFISVITMNLLDENKIKKIIAKEYENSYIEKLLPWAFKESIIEVGSLLFHPNQFKKRLANLLIEIYESPYFLSHIEANRYRYQETIHHLEKELKTKTPLELGQKLMSKTFRNVFDYKLYIFCPTYFISPHRLRVHNQNTNFIIYDINKDHLQINKALGKIVNAMKILSDQTRIEILRQLSIKPTYGKVLANSLDLTTATISHHLELLKTLGLIKEEKVKNIKYFSVNQEEVEKILTLTSNYIHNKL